ncbi:hypothetical protein SAMN02745165_02729 [Malonomonas rubra DSM 5091]|uniref:Uncharacterized protein n=1 Tax=Malonomonas rubra DSM 5091 TaxID=1122189 RepID=A0A1M6KIB1_MALRU|nr:hypothetical protein [Malonomonas rubra]SHJ58686.1 hypothetical protein SAMN02745165_02729 [Malonomonas rubra DSM 5091]
MSDNQTQTEIFDKNNYQISDLDSEIRVDRLCSELLKAFHQYLLQELKLEPIDAGSQAAGADYFLREFLIGSRQENIFDCTAKRARQFGGHWYIIRNLEPNMEELTTLLSGTAGFYQYCAHNKLISEKDAREITRTCADLDYYRQRIEDFHAIVGDGFASWEKACPL